MKRTILLALIILAAGSMSQPARSNNAILKLMVSVPLTMVCGSWLWNTIYNIYEKQTIETHMGSGEPQSAKITKTEKINKAQVIQWLREYYKKYEDYNDEEVNSKINNDIDLIENGQASENRSISFKSKCLITEKIIKTSYSRLKAFGLLLATGAAGLFSLKTLWDCWKTR
jgi:hypothetical protein